MPSKTKNALILSRSKGICSSAPPDKSPKNVRNEKQLMQIPESNAMRSQVLQGSRLRGVRPVEIEPVSEVALLFKATPSLKYQTMTNGISFPLHSKQRKTWPTERGRAELPYTLCLACRKPESEYDRSFEI